MAVTKTHPIKSTLKAAIDYILNPEKTDGKLLASSFGCGLETADIEFAWTRKLPEIADTFRAVLDTILCGGRNHTGRSAQNRHGTCASGVRLGSTSLF